MFDIPLGLNPHHYVEMVIRKVLADYHQNIVENGDHTFIAQFPQRVGLTMLDGILYECRHVQVIAKWEDGKFVVITAYPRFFYVQ